MRAAVTIVHAPGVDGPTTMHHALAASGFRQSAAEVIDAAVAAKGRCRAIVLPSLEGYRAGSPAATDPLLVEHLLDVLFDLGAEPAVGAARSTASLWLENRDPFVAADLLGYRYETPGGRPYDLVDLAEDVDEGAFDLNGCLAGAGLSRAWRDCDLRIVFSSNRTDEEEGYALTLATLIEALPAVDKDYQYRYRRDVGRVCAELLDAAPVHFALIDAVVSSHGAGGARAPRPIQTDTVIVARDPVLADYVGALKMGLDPLVSGLATPSLDGAALSSQQVHGSLARYPGWINVPAPLRASAVARRQVVHVDRTLKPWLQEVDREVFPFRNPADDWFNKALSGFASVGDDGADQGVALLTLINLWLAEAGTSTDTWRVMFDKDALRRRAAPLNIDPDLLSEQEYDELPSRLHTKIELLQGSSTSPGGMRWVLDGETVVFDGVRRFLQPFEDFTRSVEIHRSIQFMNDYIGGAARVTGRDVSDRVTRQVERNLYLPQPNYTAVGGGTVIDVTKIETVTYGERRQRMYWRTLLSENDSAVVDDGIVTFEAVGDDTMVTIWGRQHFRLPPLWAAIDETLPPSIKRTLIDEAYTRFFERTFANLEGVAEGRDMRIGQPWRDEANVEPRPVERFWNLARGLEKHGGIADILKEVVGTFGNRRPTPVRIDSDGFRHFEAFSHTGGAQAETSAVARVVADLRAAIGKDFSRSEA